MKETKRVATITLVIMLGLIAYGLVRTGRSKIAAHLTPGDESPQAGHMPAIDQSSLDNARRLVQMPTAADELPIAHEALRLADREMDLAFSSAVGEIQENPPALNTDAKQSEARLQKAEHSLEADNARVEQLNSALSKATGVEASRLNDQMEEAKVQDELDQDEVDNAKQEVTLAGGDTQGRIEQLMKEHDDASRVADTTTVNTSLPPDRNGLVHRYQQWSELQDKKVQLWGAKRDAESSVVAFAAKRDALQSNVQTKTQPPEVRGDDSAGSHEASAKHVSDTKRRSATVKAVTRLEERIEDQKNLAEIYGKWLDVISAQQRAVIHRGLSGVAVIVVILLIGIFFDSWLKRLFDKIRLDPRRSETLYAVVSIGLQIIALGFVLLVIFGQPSQLGTILGLAGAGLTVALKDFIISFIGWFVLMGRNGIRLGDWVEVNGVTGEVTELGVFHTVLLETGNWTDSGHPTGRRVTFTNSFAIEGHYFNFSTSGQWLWDELTLILTSGHDPYPIVEAIQKAVLEATAESAGQAEKEWQYAAHSRSMRALSAAPAVNVKPVSGGFEIAVRYIARANERYQLRSKLYRAAMRLISKQDSRTPTSSSEKTDPNAA